MDEVQQDGGGEKDEPDIKRLFPADRIDESTDEQSSGQRPDDKDAGDEPCLTRRRPVRLDGMYPDGDHQ